MPSLSPAEISTILKDVAERAELQPTKGQQMQDVNHHQSRHTIIAKKLKVSGRIPRFSAEFCESRREPPWPSELDVAFKTNQQMTH
jgi:hypothetical protein